MVLTSTLQQRPTRAAAWPESSFCNGPLCTTRWVSQIVRRATDCSCRKPSAPLKARAEGTRHSTALLRCARLSRGVSRAAAADLETSVTARPTMPDNLPPDTEVQAVLFDMDGVLCDSEEVSRE